jgi:hypothetical protein
MSLIAFKPLNKQINFGLDRASLNNNFSNILLAKGTPDLRFIVEPALIETPIQLPPILKNVPNIVHFN